MPESEAKSHHVNNGKGMHPHQSAWLTHWTGTSTHDHLSQLPRSEINDHDIKKPLTGVELEDAEFTTNLKNRSGQSFPFFKRGQVEQVFGPQVSHGKPTTGFKYHMFFGETSSQPSDEEGYNLHGHNFAKKCDMTELPPCSRQNNESLLKGGPSTSSPRSPAFMEEQYKRMQKHIGMRFLPHQDGSCSYQNVPHFVQDSEMPRMSGGLHSFSQTTHSLLIMKQTDVNVYQESQMYRESRVSTHFSQGQRGLKIQLLDSPDHELQENVENDENVKAQKNELSADTDAMDMEAFKQNRLSDVCLSAPNKDIIPESNLPLLPLVTLSTENDTLRKRKTKLPDINLEISTLPAASTSTDKTNPSTSRTQSLDMNTLRFNLDRPTNSRSEECSNSNPGLDPENRWIKRLKLTASNPLALGTKISKRVEPSFHKRNGKESDSLVECRESGKREFKDVTLSHSWIKRWSHKQNRKNVETTENAKFATEDIQKKQFPSIAAMARMGKAMIGFQQCKFEKRDSFLVWNTKTFEE